ncbi:peptidylprolyl isomerase [Patescibacteria group bacterium]|nr:peptidylprolyl isomerase [Patescibacteria group bacterium]
MPKQDIIDQSAFEDLVSSYSKAILKTSEGDITVTFYGDKSPKTVNNFLNLAKMGFYDGTKFHRVISDFMIQGGDPLSKEENTMLHGTGGPGYSFDDEFNEETLVKGGLAMANSGPDTNGSQFFIVTKESTPWLDGKHTNFGEVTGGMDVVESMETVKTDSVDHPIEDITIEEIVLEK